MSKYENFNNLVANHIDTAKQSVMMDICYLFGKIDGFNHEEDLGLAEADDAYDFKGVNVVIGKRENEYIMYVLRHGSDEPVILGKISRLFERYQIADIFSDMYLNFYMNCNVEEMNAVIR